MEGGRTLEVRSVASQAALDEYCVTLRLDRASEADAQQ